MGVQFHDAFWELFYLQASPGCVLPHTRNFRPRILVWYTTGRNFLNCVRDSWLLRDCEDYDFKDILR